VNITKNSKVDLLEIEVAVVGVKAVAATKFAGKWRVKVTLLDDATGEALAERFVAAMSRAMQAAVNARSVIAP
jgi:hypothetical protein